MVRSLPRWLDDDKAVNYYADFCITAAMLRISQYWLCNYMLIKQMIYNHDKITVGWFAFKQSM